MAVNLPFDARHLTYRHADIAAQMLALEADAKVILQTAKRAAKTELERLYPGQTSVFGRAADGIHIWTKPFVLKLHVEWVGDGPAPRDDLLSVLGRLTAETGVVVDLYDPPPPPPPPAADTASED